MTTLLTVEAKKGYRKRKKMKFPLDTEWDEMVKISTVGE